MSKEIAWELFKMTGKVEYYMAYKKFIDSEKK